jgi:cytochrome b561
MTHGLGDVGARARFCAHRASPARDDEVIGNDAERYGAVAQILHWLIAALVFVMFGLGWYMTDLPLGQRKFDLYQLHKSFGLTIFALAVVRLCWRLLNPAPPLPTHMARWERSAAHASHGLLYTLLLVQPSLGFLQSNAANFPVVVWDVLPLPALLAPDEPLAETLAGVHGLVANLIFLLVVLHAAAALRHHFWLKDNVLRRMLPGRLPGP